MTDLPLRMYGDIAALTTQLRSMKLAPTAGIAADVIDALVRRQGEQDKALLEARALFEGAFDVADRADPADAAFPLLGADADFYHAARATLLSWVLEMLPNPAPQKADA